jgi:hypothetical protein
MSKDEALVSQRGFQRLLMCVDTKTNNKQALLAETCYATTEYISRN